MSPCVEASGWRTPFGYVSKRFKRKTYYAHRLAWQQAFGPIPNGMYVLHRCDNPACVNVEHLFLGTHADNMGDRQAKGRTPRTRGSKHGMAQMNEWTAVGVMARLLRGGESQSDLAREFGVDRHVIGGIWHCRTWAHVFGLKRRSFGISGEPFAVDETLMDGTTTTVKSEFPCPEFEKD